MPVPDGVELPLSHKWQEVVVLDHQDAVRGHCCGAFGQGAVDVLLVSQGVRVHDEPRRLRCGDGTTSVVGQGFQPRAAVVAGELSNGGAGQVRMVGEEGSHDTSCVQPARLRLHGPHGLLQQGLGRSELDERAPRAPPQFQPPARVRSGRFERREVVGGGLRSEVDHTPRCRIAAAATREDLAHHVSVAFVIANASAYAPGTPSRAGRARPRKISSSHQSRPTWDGKAFVEQAHLLARSRPPSSGT